MHISRCKRVADLADIVTENGGRLNGIHLTALWSALAWMHVHSAHRAEPGSVQHGVLADLILLTRERAQHLSSRSVAGVLHALGTLSPSGTNHLSLADLLVRRATERAVDFCPRDAAQLLHGLSNLDLQSRAVSRLLAAMQGALAAKAAQCDAHTIAVAVSSVSRMGAPAAPEMLSALQARAAAIAGSFTAQGVANLMVGLAHLGGEVRLSAALSRAFQRVAQEGAGDFSAQDVAKLLWAFATMGVAADERLVRALQRRAAATAHQARPEDIGKALWALAMMRAPTDAVLQKAMQARAAATAADFSPQSVSLALWAVGAHDAHQSPPFMAAMQTRAVALALKGELRPQHVGSLLLALARCDAETPRAVQAALESALAEAAPGEFDPRALALVAAGLARAGVAPRAALLEALAARAADAAPWLSAQELADVLWAFATLGGAGPPRLGAAAGARAEALAPELSAVQAALVLWALACFPAATGGGAAPPVLGALARRCLALRQDLAAAELSQLHQVQSAQRPARFQAGPRVPRRDRCGSQAGQPGQVFLSLRLAADAGGSAAAVPEDVARLEAAVGGRGREAFTAGQPPPSRLQQEVAGALRGAFPGAVVEANEREPASGCPPPRAACARLPRPCCRSPVRVRERSRTRRWGGAVRGAGRALTLRGTAAGTAWTRCWRARGERGHGSDIGLGGRQRGLSTWTRRVPLVRGKGRDVSG